MKTSDSTPRHPIRVVAQRTGLTLPTIRAWERRYSAVTPSRSEGGQRLYSDRDVGRLSMLKQLTDVGRPISMVAELPDDEVRALLDEDRGARTAVSETNGVDPAHALERSYACVLDLETEALERTLWRAAVSLDGATFLDAVVAPLLVRIGDGWVAGEVTPGQEHLASDVIDRVLSRVADRVGSTEGPRIVVATLPGERHGLGARLVAAAASVDGWSVTFMGTDLPVADIATTARRVDAAAVAISVVDRDHLDDAVRGLESLRELLSPTVDLLVGGGGASMIEADRLPRGVRLVAGLEGFRHLRRNGR